MTEQDEKFPTLASESESKKRGNGRVRQQHIKHGLKTIKKPSKNLKKLRASVSERKKKQEEQKPQASLDLIVRKTADGNIMIMDHTDIDVIIMPLKNKVLTVAKEALTDDVYDSQNRLFKYLSKKGLLDLSSIRSGNIYGSLEAAYIAETFNGADPAETIVFGVGKFMEEEKPY